MPSLLIVVFVLTSPWHYPASVYFFLRMMLITPNGGIAWFAIVLIVAVSASGIVFFVSQMRQMRKQAILGIVGKPSPWLLVTPIIMLKLLIGPAVALAVWSEIQAEGTLSSPKKGVIETPEMRLRVTLKSIEHRGVTTWWVNRPDSRHD